MHFQGKNVLWLVSGSITVPEPTSCSVAKSLPRKAGVGGGVCEVSHSRDLQPPVLSYQWKGHGLLSYKAGVNSFVH